MKPPFPTRGEAVAEAEWTEGQAGQGQTEGQSLPSALVLLALASLAHRRSLLFFKDHLCFLRFMPSVGLS